MRPTPSEEVLLRGLEGRSDLDEAERADVRRALHGTADGAPVPDGLGAAGWREAQRRGRHGWSTHGITS